MLIGAAGVVGTLMVGTYGVCEFASMRYLSRSLWFFSLMRASSSSSSVIDLSFDAFPLLENSYTSTAIKSANVAQMSILTVFMVGVCVFFCDYERFKW